MCIKLDSYEEALYSFGNRCDVVVAMHQGGKIPLEDAFQQIKKELAKLKKARKDQKKRDEPSL